MITLVESPVPALVAGIIAVAVLAIGFFQTGRGVFLVGIAGAVLLTLVGVGVEYFVVTEREAVEAALDGLADAMLANDKEATMAYLSPAAAAVRAEANWAFGRFVVTHASISHLQVTVNDLTSPPSAKARFKGLIQVRDRQGELVHESAFYTFIVDYRKEGDRWLLTGYTIESADAGRHAQRHD